MDSKLRELLERLEYELEGGHDEMDTVVDMVSWFKKFKKQEDARV